jgi:site-specific DNA recombinase
VQVDADAVAVVRELSAAHAEGGVTLHGLAAGLTVRRIPTLMGRAVWAPSTVRGLLTNPAYKVEAASGRVRTTPAKGRRSPLQPVGHGKSTRLHPPEEWVTVPVPALVSAELFERVQRRLRANRQGAIRSTTHPYLLRGPVSCGVCRLSCTGYARRTARSAVPLRDRQTGRRAGGGRAPRPYPRYRRAPAAGLSIGAPMTLPHSVQEPS